MADTARVIRAGSDVAAGVEIKADGDASDGALAIFALSLEPAASATPHVHTRETEALVVQSGRMRLEVADEEWSLEPGDVAVIPRGVRHLFGNAGEERLQLLIVAAPAGLERFFRSIDGGTDAAAAAEAAGLRFG